MPPWLLIDGAFGLLDDDVLELVIDIFSNELKHTTIIHVGGPGEAHPLFSRTLHLIKAPRTGLAAGPGEGRSAVPPSEPGSPR